MKLATSILISAILLTLPPAAAGDSRISVQGGDLVFFSEDAGMPNNLLVEQRFSRIRLLDRVDPFGMSFPTPPCSPGETNERGNAVEVFCFRSGINRVSIEIGPGEDRVNYTVPDIPAAIDGLLGADSLTTGAANDHVAGGQGNDTLQTGSGDDVATGGQGADTISTGAGNDSAESADGIGERIDCGSGADVLAADTFDTPANCESVSRRFVAPPADAACITDSTDPRLRARRRASRRVSRRRRRVSLFVRASEPVQVRATGFLDAGGIFSRLRPAAVRVRSSRRRARLRVRLSRRQVRRVLSDVRRGRKPRLRLTLTGTDCAGNTSRSRRMTVRLRGPRRR